MKNDRYLRGGLIIIGIILSFISVLFGCNNQKEGDTDNKYNTRIQILSDGTIEKTPIKFDPKEVFYIFGFYDNKLYYCEKKEDRVLYYCSTLEGEKTLIDERSDFYVSSGYSVYIKPYLYYFIGVQSKDVLNGSGENVLIQYDTETEKTMFFYQDEAEVIPIMEWSVLGDNIVIRKEIIRGEEAFSYIELFDVNTGKWREHKRCSLNLKTNVGDCWHAVCSDGENIFGLYGVCKGDNDNRYNLIKMDCNCNEIQSVKLSENISEYLFDSFVTEMVAFRDYIYIRNASSYAILFRFSEDGLSEIIRDENLCIARTQDQIMPLFFKRYGKEIYCLNEAGELEEIDIQISGNRVIRSMFSDQKKCYIDCRGDDGLLAYIVDRRDLEHIKLSDIQ